MRTKITNQWLYATSAAAVVKALEVVEAEAIRRIDPWLLGAAPYLRGPIARASRSPAVTRTLRVVPVRELARDRRLLTLGLLTAEYEPYLGLYAPRMPTRSHARWMLWRKPWRTEATFAQGICLLRDDLAKRTLGGRSSSGTESSSGGEPSTGACSGRGSASLPDNLVARDTFLMTEEGSCARAGA